MVECVDIIKLSKNYTNFFICIYSSVATPLWVKWEDETPTPKVGDFESFGTLECLKFDSRGQNTSYWVFLVSLERS